MKICTNGRALHGPQAGVQRYVREMFSRLDEQVEVIQPPSIARSGALAHTWEQTILPLCAKNRLLWSPTGTGPLSYSRQVVTIHDLAPLEHPEWFTRKFAGYYGWLLPRLVQRVQHIICVSNFTCDRLISITNVSPDRVTVIPNGVGMRFQPKDEQARSQMRQALDLPDGRYVLSLGSLEPRKNLPRLIEGWKMVQGKLPSDFHLLIAGGKGKSSVFAKTQLEQNSGKNVIFLGSVPEEYLPSLYADAYLFVYPSLYEGFGLPALEALACGVPVLVGNYGAMSEVVGDAGIHVDPYSSSAIAGGIHETITDDTLYKRLQAMAVKQAGRFSWDGTAAATLEVLARFT